MNAQEARAIAEEVTSIDGSFKRAETDQILEAIKSAAAKGRFEISFSNTAYDYAVIVKRLKLLDFIVTVHDDQREGWCMTVSW